MIRLDISYIGPPLPRTCSLVRKVPAFGNTVVVKYCDLTSALELSDLSFQWKKVDSNGQLADVPLEGRFSVNHDGWLTIENLQTSDLGEYRVNILSEMGSALHTVQLELVRGTTASPSQTTTQAEGQHQAQSQLGKCVIIQLQSAGSIPPLLLLLCM